MTHWPANYATRKLNFWEEMLEDKKGASQQLLAQQARARRPPLRCLRGTKETINPV